MLLHRVPRGGQPYTLPPVGTLCTLAYPRSEGNRPERHIVKAFCGQGLEHCAVIQRLSDQVERVMAWQWIEALEV